MKKFSFLLVLFNLLSNMLLFGCEYKDINRRLFVVAIGIDKSEYPQQIKLTAKAAIPISSSQESAGQKQAKFEIYTTEADSVGEALRKLKIQTTLEPDYAHMKVLVLSKDFIDEHPLDDIIRYFIRRRDTQNIAYFTVGLPTAAELLKIASPDASAPGGEIYFKFGQGTKSPYAVRTRLFEVYRSIVSPGETLYCPVTEVRNNKVEVDRAALFSKDNKVSYILSPEETKILKIMSNTPHNAFITHKEENNRTIGMNIEKSSTKFKFNKEEDKYINCDVNVKIIATIEQSHYVPSDPAKIKLLFEQELNKKIADLINRLKSQKVDPLLLCSKYWAVTPSFDLTDDWSKKIFPTIKFNVNCKVKILNTGALR